MKAAIYARYSTELQNEKSIEDQVELCADYAQRNGLELVAAFEDRARSGASTFGRDGLMRMMDAARDHAFDVVIVEGLDCLSRDQEDLAGIWKRLNFLGIEIRAVHDGKADQMQIGLRGLVAALFLKDLSEKTRRGPAGVVRDGRHAGGRSFGYRPVLGKPGELEIVEAEAETVRLIFRLYCEGKTPREIAAILNERKIAPPRGRYWAASTINGSIARRNGVILNDLYAGKIVWNRQRFLKDPDTGKRVSRPNPQSEWQTKDAPHLRIVDQETFDEAQAVKKSRGGSRPHTKRKIKYALSGLLTCGCCGAGMTIKDRRGGKIRIHCARMKESGTCDHKQAYDMALIERTVFNGLKENLTDPALIAEYVEAYNTERRRLSSDLISRRSGIEGRLASTKREIDRLLESYMKGFADDEEMKAKMFPLREEKSRLEIELENADQPVNVVTLHPATIKRYREQVENLQQAMSTEALGGDQEPVKAIRELIEAIVIQRVAAGEPMQLELRGRLSALIGKDFFPQGKITSGLEGRPPTVTVGGIVGCGSRI